MPKNLVLGVAARDFDAMRPAAEKLVDMIVRAIARQVLEQAEVVARAGKTNAPFQKARASRTVPSGERITSVILNHRDQGRDGSRSIAPFMEAVALGSYI